MAELCKAQHRWREADEYLDRLARVSHDTPVLLRNALLQRSHILGEQLYEEEQAMAVLKELLQIFPRDRDALEYCLQLYRHRGNYDQMVTILEEMVHIGSPEERVEYLVEMAEILSRLLNNPAAANRALKRAIAVCIETKAPTCGEASEKEKSKGSGLERIIEYFERRGDFERLADFLAEALRDLPPEGAPGSVPVRLARARILAGRLLQPELAEKEILKALQSDTASIAARLELAGLHLWADKLAEATAQYLRILELDPFAVEAYRGLYRIFERRGDVERAAGLAQVVSAVAGKDVPERKIAEQATVPMEASLSFVSATPLGVYDFWNLLAHPDEPPAARELLYLVADYIPMLFEPEMKAITIGSLPLTTDHPLTLRCLKLAQVMGIDRLECYLSPSLPHFIEALPGGIYRIVLDEPFTHQASPGEFRFALGRALTGILTRSVYLWAIHPQSLQLLFAAVIGLFEKTLNDPRHPNKELEELTKLVNRVIPRKVRRAIEEIAKKHAASERLNIKEWADVARRSAERGGLLLSGDVEASLKVLRAERSSRAVQADLLRFVVGPHLYEARRRLGISI
jgi:tetratricopeptide (TPR) repeat protein